MRVKLPVLRFCYPAYSRKEYLEKCVTGSAKMLTKKFLQGAITADELERIIHNPNVSSDWRELLTTKVRELLQSAG
jgi:hypothetical protein